MNGRGDRRHYNFMFWSGGAIAILFSNVFVIGSLIVAGERFAPLPGHLGRFTSGQELQVSLFGPRRRVLRTIAFGRIFAQRGAGSIQSR